MNEEANKAIQTTDSVRTCGRIRPIDEELTQIAYERSQIGERIHKLEAAIKANPEAVSDYHKGLWKIQLDAMEGYYNALGERIKDFIDQTERK